MKPYHTSRQSLKHTYCNTLCHKFYHFQHRVHGLLLETNCTPPRLSIAISLLCTCRTHILCICKRIDNIHIHTHTRRCTNTYSHPGAFALNSVAFGKWDKYSGEEAGPVIYTLIHTHTHIYIYQRYNRNHNTSSYEYEYRSQRTCHGARRPRRCKNFPTCCIFSSITRLYTTKYPIWHDRYR